MRPSQQELDERFEAVYEQYGKPLEAEHWGRFMVVSADGEVILGDTLSETEMRAIEQFGRGKGLFVFKVGEKSVGKIR